MTETGGAAGNDLSAKKKGPSSGCLTIFGIVVVLLIVLSVVSSNNANREREAAAADASALAEISKQVSDTTATKVKDACVTQAKTVAANAGREIAGVQPKFYTIGSTSFSGDVEKINMLHEKIAYEVTFTYQAVHKDGTTNSTTRTCRVNDNFDFVELRPNRG